MQPQRPIDKAFMLQTIELAQLGTYSTRPNPCVGCMIVKDQNVVASAWHKYAGHDHAEILALHQAGENAKGATMYISLEPCSHQGKTPPCINAIKEAGITRVVVAMKDPNPKVNGKGVQALKKHGIEVEVGICGPEAYAINEGFFYSMENQRPFIRIKHAMSFDGRIASYSGESKWITGELARMDVQKLRAQSGAIITGMGTIKHDDPSLTVRFDQWPEDVCHLSEQPLRIVLDSKLHISPSASIFDSDPEKVWVVTCNSDKSKYKAIEDLGAKVHYWPDKEGKHVDLNTLLKHLHEEQIHDVLVESGGRVAGAFFENALANQYWIYLSPTLLGDEGVPVLKLPSVRHFKDRKQLRIKHTTQVGEDLRVILET